MANFAIIGAGYIHQRHLLAINSLGHQLVLGHDTSTNTINFRDKKFLLENEIGTFYQLLKQKNVDWVSVCTPTNTHFNYIIQALRAGCDVIAEKPICLNMEELTAIQQEEKRNNKKVYSIFQLRYLPAIKNLQTRGQNNEAYVVYKGFRPKSYFNSWKGDIEQSGGIVAAIGIHYFDILTNHFGKMLRIPKVKNLGLTHSKGEVQLERAIVHWDFEFTTEEYDNEIVRSLAINDQIINLTNYNYQLHTEAYRAILDGVGVHTNEARKSLEIVEAINKNYNY